MPVVNNRIHIERVDKVADTSRPESWQGFMQDVGPLSEDFLINDRIPPEGVPRQIFDE